MLTLRELLADLDLTVRAGDEALDTPVRWVHISELEDPTPWLSGGELLLTTGMALPDAHAQRAYVARLADHGLAGLGFGTGLAHSALPEALRDAAAERGFPLVEVPYATPFIAVTEKAFSRLVNEQYALLQRAIAVHDRLQRIVLGEQGLEAIVAALSELLGATVIVYDARGELRARHDHRRGLTDELVTGIATEVRERARRDEPRGFAPTGADLALPVAGHEGAPQAWLVAAKDAGGLSELDRVVLHQAVNVVALELLRRHVAESTERRLAGDVVAEVVSGTLAGQELARRLKPFGLGPRVSALVAAADAAPALMSAIAAEGVEALVAATPELACALLPGLADDDLVELAGRVARRAATPVGVARAAAAGDARRALLEARCALEARNLTPGANGNGVATWRDLGSVQLLLSLQGTDALSLFCDSLLGPIEAGEGAYGGELVRSLEAFIEANGQWEAAARTLFCHRHTLRYRIRKVEELTGRDLGNARDRIEFWLALRGRELV